MHELSHMLVQAGARMQKPLAGAPHLTAGSCEVLREIEIVDEFGERRIIGVPAERPLTIVVDGQELVTLMTLGAAPEFLVLGYMFNQRLIRGVAEIESVAVDWKLGAATVITRGGVNDRAAGRVRRGSTGCGLGTVFGDFMGEIDLIRLPAPQSARIRQSTLYALLETMREQESLHRTAGSVHGCALFRGAELLVFVEDVARHNAIDTVIGWMAVHGVAGADKIFYTTGRLSGEMVMKSAQIGVPIAVSRNGATAMGIEVAGRLGMTLIGRAAKRRVLCYVGAERLDSEPEPHLAENREMELK
jgi:FdhD protein